LEQKRSSLPKDFEKNKAKLLEDYKNQQTGTKFQQLMEEERKKAKIVFHDPSLEWRYAYAKSNPMMGMITPDSQGSAADLEKKLREYLKTNASDSEAALVLGKQIYQNYLMTAPGPQREKLRDEVIEFYEMALGGSEDRDTRLSTAQLYREAGKKDLALKHYRTLQRLLRWDDSPATKTIHTQLETAFKELGDKESAEKSAKRIVELTAIEKKQQAEQKAAEAKAKEEAKKAAEKAKADAKKNASKPAPASTGTAASQNPPGPPAADSKPAASGQ
jgi:hypothetical protein